MRWMPRRLPFIPSPRDRPFLDRLGRVYWTVPVDRDPPSMLRLMHRGTAVGFVEIDWRLPDRIEGFGIIVDAPYRRRGLGRALIRALVTTARQHRVKLIHGYVRQSDLIEQPFLLDWYYRQGFRVISEESVLTAARLEMQL